MCSFLSCRVRFRGMGLLANIGRRWGESSSALAPWTIPVRKGLDQQRSLVAYIIEPSDEF
jgi:hypothetical protein